MEKVHFELILRRRQRAQRYSKTNPGEHFATDGSIYIFPITALSHSFPIQSVVAQYNKR